jgi:hypothetical protein
MLLILVLNVGDDSKPIHEDYQIYSTEEACNAAGRALQDSLEYPAPEYRSISVCIPQSAFDPKPLDHVVAEPDPAEAMRT